MSSDVKTSSGPSDAIDGRRLVDASRLILTLQ